MQTSEFSLAELARILGVSFAGEGDIKVSGLATLAAAGSAQLSFYNNPRYQQDLLNTRAAAVILHPDHADKSPVSVLLSEQPYITFARASQLFARRIPGQPGIHSTASVDPASEVDVTASIGANAVIEAGASVGAGCHIAANCYIGANSQVGKNCWLHANVTVYEDVIIGADAIIHSGVVIGADGFGFAWDGWEHVKIEQLGGVRIGKNVEIGAGTTIDRGALDDTEIADGVKIDNQVQVAHNVKVGANTVICGCSAIAGSATIGANCVIAGAVGIINHIKLVDGVTVTAMSLVNRDIKEPGVYSSGTGLSKTSQWKRNMLRFGELDAMAKQLQRLANTTKD